MFRQLCVLALAFLAVSEAHNNSTKAAKSLKDSKSVKTSNKKVKTATMCAFLDTDEIHDDTSVISTSQGFILDCDMVATPNLNQTDFIGVLAFNCMGPFDNNDDSELPEVLCHGLITVNTEDVKSAKSDFSSIALSTWAAVDDLSIASAGEPLDLTQLFGTTITGTTGAWGKSDNIKDLSFARKTNAVNGDYYEIDLDYKFKGFNPVA